MRIELQQTGFVQVLPGLLYAFLGTIIVFVIHFYPWMLENIPPCLFREFFHIPCPACGATRSGIFLSHLKMWNAFIANPFFFLVYISVFFWGINALAGLLFKRNLKIQLNPKESGLLYKLIILSFPLNWIFLILVHLFTGRNGQ